MSHIETKPRYRPVPALSAPRPTWSARHPGWPIVALLAGYPFWWALGVADYMFVVLAVPMALRMHGWHRRNERSIRLPRGFGLWLLFLLCMVAGVAALSLTAPGTVASPISNRVLSWALRAVSYIAVTVLLLYAGNLTERELPRRRLAWLLGLVAIYATIGGIAGMLAPRFQFTSPLGLVVPKSLQNNTQFQALLHPGLAQIQNVLGAPEGRPKAPFDYTNSWGECISLLLPWLVVGWWSYGTRRQRRIAIAVLGIAIVPIVYSLNRGVWLALIAAVCYLAVRLALRGRIALLGVVCTGLVLLAVTFAVTPLQTIVSQRLANGQSDQIRGSLTITSIRDAASSPLIGYGDTRHQQGSVNSLAVGPTQNCITCGQYTVGSNGQLWLLLVCGGFLGAALYLGFFAFGVWRYWSDITPYGLAGVLVLLMTFVFMFTYDAVGPTLGFTMLAYALLWRSDRALTLGRESGQRGPEPSVDETIARRHDRRARSSG